MFLVAAGGVLCAMWAVPTVSAAVMSRMEIDAFHTRAVKMVAWDRARVRAYQKTLRVKVGSTEGVLTIDRLGVKVPVLDGTSEFTLNRGVGHIDGTAMPGQPGNVAITGHRDGFFRPLKDIARGDVITLERDGGTDQYVVSDMKIVSPSDTSVLAPTEKNTLTLVTCYPFYFIGPAPQRYIVTASLMTAAKQVASNAGPGLHQEQNSGE